MSEKAAKRQRRTNQLTGAAAAYLFTQEKVVPDQIYGLCRLTWITDSYEGLDAAYVRSTKKPALGEIFKQDYSALSIVQVADDIARIVGSPEIGQLVISDTGFTNFYKAYRNTARQWIRDNFETVLPLFKIAYKLALDAQGLKLGPSSR